MTQEQIQLLRDQVDQLQIEAVRRRTPWYRQVAILISVAAFFFSAATSVITFARESAQQVSSTREEIRSLILQLVSLDASIRAGEYEYGAEPQATFDIIFSAITDLDHQIPFQLSFEDYAVVAEMYWFHGNLTMGERAFDWYEKAIRATDYDLDKARAHKYLAQMFADKEDWDSCEEEMLVARDLLSRHRGTNVYDYHSSLLFLLWAEFYSDRDDSEAALRMQKQCLTLLRGLKDPVLRDRILDSAAKVFQTRAWQMPVELQQYLDAAGGESDPGDR